MQKDWEVIFKEIKAIGRLNMYVFIYLTYIPRPLGNSPHIQMCPRIALLNVFNNINTDWRERERITIVTVARMILARS